MAIPSDQNDAAVPTPETLMASVKSSDTEAFTLLVNSQGGSLLAMARVLVGNHADADDVNQEAWKNIWCNARTFDQAKLFMPWAREIMRNASVDFKRRRGETIVDSGIVEHSVADDDSPPAYLLIELSADVNRALGTLEEWERRVLEQLYWYDCSVPQVAVLLGVNRTHVYRILRTIFAKVRRELPGYVTTS